MIRSIETTIFFRTPKGVSTLPDLGLAFRDVLLIDFFD